MAEVNPPFAIQASSHPASSFRKVVAGLRGQAGVIAVGDMAVSQNGTPNMSVNVAAGKAVVDGTENAQSQGSYLVHNDAVKNVTVAASDPTNPRWDLVVAKVQDAEYSGATNAWSLAVVTGTPAPSPADPAVPNNAIKLARLVIAANATTVVNANITDLRPSGAILNNLVAPSPPAVAAGIGASPLAARADHVHPFAGTAYLFDEQSISAGASFTIPAAGGFPTGRMLRIYWRAKTDNAAAQTLAMRFNGDSGANYLFEDETTSGTAWTITSNTAQTSARIGAGADNAANTLDWGVIEIPFYADAAWKGYTCLVSRGDPGVSNNIGNEIATGYWKSTAAITSITIFLATGNFHSGGLTKFSTYVVL